MAKEVWLLDEVEVEVSGWFTTHHTFRTHSGSLGECKISAFSQQATFRTVDGRELLMQKTSWLGSSFELIVGGTVRGAAHRPGLLRRDITLEYDDRAYSLQPEGLLARGWFLLDAVGNQLLEIQPRGVFKQGAILTITGNVDADLVAFAYYLVHVRQQEEAAGAAAAAGAS
jgi:hypothetical protein